MIDTRLFQRLRGIRQNGVTNLVFHGAEHSRFSHSMGVAWLAGAMFDSAAVTAESKPTVEEREDVVLAGLLHDVGHGPFSHALEEILASLSNSGSTFHHETLTKRIMEEQDSPIAKILRSADPQRPKRLVGFIDKKQRDESAWFHSLVSSQLDADRLDYVLRDCLMTGYRRPADLRRLLGALTVVNSPYDGSQLIAVDARAVDVLESVILTLDQLYEFVYYHHAVRAANLMLQATIQRAVDLAREGHRDALFPKWCGGEDPLLVLIEKGNNVPLETYAELDEAHVWSLISRWRSSTDLQLASLATGLTERKFRLTYIDLKGLGIRACQELVSAACEMCKKKLNLDDRYFVVTDEPSRVSYKRYSAQEGAASSIQVIGRDGKVHALEEQGRTVTKIVSEKNYFPRLYFPKELASELRSMKEHRS